MNRMTKTRKSGLKLQEAVQSGWPAKYKNNGYNHISPLLYSDVEEVAALSQIYFPGSNKVSFDSLKKTIEELYFKDYPHPEITSLVSRTPEGYINGFLGVTTQSFLYKGSRQITVANCHHLMATEQARSRLVPLKLLKKFLSGPQDISFADGSVESTRHLWKRLGGEPSFADSLYFKVPLRPVSFAVRPLLNKLNKPLSGMAKLFASGTDTVGKSLRLPLFRRRQTGARLIPLTSTLLIEGMGKLKNGYSIFPDYEQWKVDRLFRLLNNGKIHGTLHKIAIMDEIEGIIGWFIYYSKKGDVCEVVQAVSVPGKEKLLFDSLVWHAYRQGGVELSGRLMAQHMRTPFTTSSYCMPARMWTLIHSTEVELKHQIQSGNAFLTRLEGDLWLL